MNVNRSDLSLDSTNRTELEGKTKKNFLPTANAGKHTNMQWKMRGKTYKHAVENARRHVTSLTIKHGKTSNSGKS